jgi:hypothetical protein
MRRQAAVSDPRTKEGTTTMPLLQALRPTLPILIGASLMLSLSMGLRQSLGIFLQPLTHDVGISVSDFTLAIAVQNLAWGFLQPLAGAMTVRYGFRQASDVPISSPAPSMTLTRPCALAISTSPAM